MAVSAAVVVMTAGAPPDNIELSELSGQKKAEHLRTLLGEVGLEPLLTPRGLTSVLRSRVADAGAASVTHFRKVRPS